MNTLVALLALVAFSASAQPVITARLAEGAVGSGRFEIYADGGKVLSFAQGKKYDTFVFDLRSEPSPGGAVGIYRHQLRAGGLRGRVAPAEYYWTGPACKRVEIVMDPRRVRPGE